MAIKEEKIVIDGISVNFKVSGQGEPVLILHGWGGSSNSWVKVIEILAGHGFKVICPDLPGFGKSDFPDDGWKMARYVKFTLKILERFGLEKIDLIGHSFGGALAIKFAAMYPEKIGRVVLLAPAVLRRKVLTPRQKIALRLTKLSNWLFGNSWIKKTFHPLAAKIVYKIAGSYDYYLAKGAMKETFKNVVAEDLSYILPEVKSPVFLIWGTNDKAVPVEDAAFLKSKIENCSAKIIEGAGHNPHLKNPGQIAGIILSFLKSENAS